jgi:hypothetical protein
MDWSKSVKISRSIFLFHYCDTLSYYICEVLNREEERGNVKVNGIKNKRPYTFVLTLILEIKIDRPSSVFFTHLFGIVKHVITNPVWLCDRDVIVKYSNSITFLQVISVMLPLYVTVHTYSFAGCDSRNINKYDKSLIVILQ